MNNAEILGKIKTINWKQGLFRLWLVVTIPCVLIGFGALILSDYKIDAIGLILAPFFYGAAAVFTFYLLSWIAGGFKPGASISFSDLINTIGKLRSLKPIAKFLTGQGLFTGKKYRFLFCAFLYFAVWF